MKYKVILFDVNKESHDIITKETINDENELKYVTNKELREKVIDLFSENGINKIYIPIESGHLLDTFKDFVVYANSKDIKIYNLIGDPTSIKEDGYERTITEDDLEKFIKNYSLLKQQLMEKNG